MKALIWKTQRKKTRKCSKASVKKYQKRPTLGVRSGTVRLEDGGEMGVDKWEREEQRRKREK